MKVAVVGTSGAVGQELLKVLEERNFPLDELILFGSKRSAGSTYKFKNTTYTVQELKENDDFKEVDIALVSAGGSVSKTYAETITKHGAIMIDNSSAFRMEDNVPLVVPELNAKDLHDLPGNIVANPNCTTIQMVVALKPIEELSHIKKVHAATYQSASGAGAAAMQELIDQIKAIANDETVHVDKFAYQLAQNLIPQVDVFTKNLYTKEEMKMYNESRKIMHSDIEVSTTCVRVPVMRNHSEALWIETEDELSVEQVQGAMKKAKGVVLVDNPEKQEYPMPINGEGKDEIFVGRIRKDLTNPKGIALWCVGDQIKKGAALNAVQIAEYLVDNNLV